jgi:type IV pilus assembly protein PilB
MENPLLKNNNMLGGNLQGGVESDRQWLDNLLNEAIGRRTSDIHIEPGEHKSVMRLRIDGMLYELDTFEKYLHPTIVSQIKVISSLDIANVHFPQDGQFHYEFDDRTHYVRVSTFPTIYGEAVVMRILNRRDSLLGLSDLGFDEKQLSDITKIIHKPFGMILTTGPSGSGKSTLLNSLLNELNTGENNIITIEDPVEFHIEGVRQTQINPYHEFGFAEALRAILRQDPDIMMIGEIRDADTAQIAVQATLTGRRFFSTFHTLDVFAIITRFIEMGISKSVVAHVIGGVISARLVRKIHDKCKVPYEVKDHEMRMLGHLLPEGIALYQGEGCAECSNTGYYGTTGIFEVVPFDDELRTAVIENISLESVKPLLAKKEIKSLLGSAMDKVVQGVTTPEEVIRVTGGDTR